MRLLEVGTRTGRAAESLLHSSTPDRLSMSGLSRARRCCERPAEARPLAWRPSVPLECNTLAAHAHSADIIWLNNALHVCCRKIPGSLRHYNSLPFPAAALRDGVSPVNAVRPTQHALLTNGQPEALLHNSADWAALLARPPSTVSMAMRSRGYNASRTMS